MSDSGQNAPHDRPNLFEEYLDGQETMTEKQREDWRLAYARLKAWRYIEQLKMLPAGSNEALELLGFLEMTDRAIRRITFYREPWDDD